VHLNIEPIESKMKKEKTVSKFIGKIFWALIALLAPDILLAIALHQLLAAWKYCNAVNKPTTGQKRGSSPNKDGPETDREDMKLKMAFFAIMGGFSVEFNTVESRLLYSLKINDIDNVGMMDRIHDHPLSEIQDKSKTSGIAKFVACIQAGWILMQCLGRHLNGIYITLLELNTAVHVLIAIVMYCIWWQKPVDIDEPIIIDRRGTYSTTTGHAQYEFQRMLGEAGGVLKEGLDRDTHAGEPKDSVKAARMATIICDSINVTPDETARLVQEIPEQIGRYFKDQLREDVRKGVHEVHKHKKIGTIPPAVVQAAFRAAYEKAHETAFRVAQRDFYKAIQQLTAGDFVHAEDSSSGSAVRSAVPSAGDAIHSQVSSTGAAIHSETPSATGVVHSEAPSSCGAVHSEVPSAGGNKQNVPSNLKEALDKVCMDTRIVTFRVAFRTAYRAASQQKHSIVASKASSVPTGIHDHSENPPSQGPHTVDSDTSSSKEIEILQEVKVLPTPTATQHPPEDPSSGSEEEGPWQEMMAATRAAHAATRSAIRQSIRLAALNAALDKTACVTAAITAFRAFLQNVSKEIDFQPEDDDIERVEHALRRAITEAFCGQYRSGLNLATFESGIRSAANLAKQATCTGLYEAARAEIERGQRVQKSGKSDMKRNQSGLELVCAEAGNKLSVPKEEAQSYGSVWERVGISLLTAGVVLWDQLIDIPDLFWPRHTSAVATVVSTQQCKREVGKGGTTVKTIEAAVPSPTPAMPTGSPSQKDPTIHSLEEQNRGAVFDDSWKRNHRIIMILFAGIAGVFYGSLHLTKWNGRFPTEMEQLLWRISSCVGTATVFPATILFWLPFAKRNSKRNSNSHLYYFYSIIAFLLCTVFLSARAYLIVESFISLRALPRDSFETVEWAFVIPHI
jgi:hypothetical protein